MHDASKVNQIRGGGAGGAPRTPQGGWGGVNKPSTNPTTLSPPHSWCQSAFWVRLVPGFAVPWYLCCNKLPFFLQVTDLTATNPTLRLRQPALLFGLITAVLVPEPSQAAPLLRHSFAHTHTVKCRAGRERIACSGAAGVSRSTLCVLADKLLTATWVFWGTGCCIPCCVVRVPALLSTTVFWLLTV